MAGKATPTDANRRRHFAALVVQATTGKRRLLAFAQWLTAASWDRGDAQMQASTDVVWEQIKAIDPLAEKALKEANQR
jgi:hypothetical protein